MEFYACHTSPLPRTPVPWPNYLPLIHVHEHPHASSSLASILVTISLLCEPSGVRSLAPDIFFTSLRNTFQYMFLTNLLLVAFPLPHAQLALPREGLLVGRHPSIHSSLLDFCEWHPRTCEPIISVTRMVIAVLAILRLPRLMP